MCECVCISPEVAARTHQNKAADCTTTSCAPRIAHDDAGGGAGGWDPKAVSAMLTFEERVGARLTLLQPLLRGAGARSGSATSLPPAAPQAVGALRFGQRRGSSMSELDKVPPDAPTTPGVVEDKGVDAAPSGAATPLRRRALDSSGDVRGSIGDLMNMKQYGSVWSVRSATEGIAAVVPLTTITHKRYDALDTFAFFRLVSLEKYRF